MHQTHYWPCLRCGTHLDPSFGTGFGKGALKCPDANKYLRVIDSKLPKVATSEEAEKVSKQLRAMGLATSGHHSSYNKETGKEYTVCVSVIEDTLEALMKHEKVDGAKYHGYNAEIMCPKCVALTRKELYDGTEKVPEIRCPICEAVMELADKKE